MFTESAELYDAIYFTFKDYAAEAANIARHIRSVHPDAHTVLDVACGTGEHARYLKEQHGFMVDGIDLNEQFIRLAQEKLPNSTFVVADMRQFEMHRTYDAIICLFSSIAYVCTLENVRQTLENFRRHLAPDGVVVVEPWFAPGVLETGYRNTLNTKVGAMSVCRRSTTFIDGRVSTLLFEYELTENGTTRNLSETHELGLFSHDEMLEAFRLAGLSVSYEAPTKLHRGLYTARIAMH